MNDAQLWRIIYAGVISIRLHPKNDDEEGVPNIDDAIEVAIATADAAVQTMRQGTQKWPG